jgi:hypothetical protein
VLDKNGIIQLDVGIGNLRSFVVSKLYSGLKIACIHGFLAMRISRELTLTWESGPYIFILHSLQAEVRKLLTIVNATAVHCAVNCITYHLLYPNGLIYPLTP